jgi:hypothetical protein
VLLFLAVSSALCHSASKVKIRGYITTRPQAETLMILDDKIHVSASTRFDLENPSAGKALTVAELVPGTLIEAEGTWTAHHEFSAEKISCNAEQFDRVIHCNAYLQTEPDAADAIIRNQSARLKADGELLLIDTKTSRKWNVDDSPPLQAPASDGTEVCRRRGSLYRRSRPRWNHCGRAYRIGSASAQRGVSHPRGSNRESCKGSTNEHRRSGDSQRQ